MKLAIFDIDGTLTQTNNVDSQCFVQAFAKEFQIKEINTNWATYGHTTDSGIALQIFQHNWGRVPQTTELCQLQQCFVELLHSHYTQTPASFVEIPGACVMLQHLAQTKDWAIARTCPEGFVEGNPSPQISDLGQPSEALLGHRARYAIAIATGGWRASAEMKLQAAGLDITQLPAAFADDSISREDIVKTAVSRAKTFYDQPDFERIIYIGDGIWDVLTAIQLQLPFVGVASDTQKPLLENAGVECIIPDFIDFESFLKALDTASIPNQHKPLQVQNNSLPASYFETLYGTNPDPWKFETSEYENKKYTATIAALPKQRYHSAFEIGGSIGVLTEKLAQRCDSLLSVDVSKIAQSRAIQRCQHLPQVRFEIMCLPQEYPDEMFDLTVVSEVGYYWCWEDLKKAQQCILKHLEPGGHLLLVHWTQYARDYPLNGDQVHDSFFDLTPTHLRHLKGKREEEYRLDVFERVFEE